VELRFPLSPLHPKQDQLSLLNQHHTLGFYLPFPLQQPVQKKPERKMDLSPEQRQVYMKLYQTLGGKETNRHELPSADVYKTLLAAAVNDQPFVDAIFRQFEKEKPFWSKIDYFKAIHVIYESKVSGPVLITFAKDVNSTILTSTRTVLEFQQNQIKTCLQEKWKVKQDLTNHLDKLKQENQYFDSMFLALSSKSQYLTANLAKEFWQQEAPTSPRSDSAFGKLNALETTVMSLEQQCFSLVPLIHLPETKTSLAILAGKTEDLQANSADAIQSLGLSAQTLVSTRRRSLVKRLDIIANLARNLHKIANDKT
jgi:hypothetical protein